MAPSTDREARTLTEKQAARAGYRIVRGAYSGTTDDRADRWYVDHRDDDLLDHRGRGFATKRDALLAIREKLDMDAWSAELDGEWWAANERQP